MSGRRTATQRRARLGGTELELGSGLLDQVAAAEAAEYHRWRAELAPLPPKAERGTIAETPWQRQIVTLAERLGFYVYHPKLSRWSARGWPDLSLLGNRGRALWIECKTDEGQLTEAQCEVISRMLACQLEVHVLRPWHGLERVAAILQGPRVAP